MIFLSARLFYLLRGAGIERKLLIFVPNKNAFMSIVSIGFVITLMILGVLLLLAEIFLVPGVGLAGFLGIASLVGSSYYGFMIGGPTGTLVTIANALIVLILIVIMLRAKTWKKFELKDTIDSKSLSVREDVEVGDRGLTVTRLAPMGTARIGGRTCEVTAFEGMLAQGTEVEVIMIEKGKIYVKPVSKNEAF